MATPKAMEICWVVAGDDEPGAASEIVKAEEVKNGPSARDTPCAGPGHVAAKLGEPGG